MGLNELILSVSTGSLLLTLQFKYLLWKTPLYPSKAGVSSSEFPQHNPHSYHITARVPRITFFVCLFLCTSVYSSLCLYHIVYSSQIIKCTNTLMNSLAYRIGSMILNLQAMTPLEGQRPFLQELTKTIRKHRNLH